MPTSAVKALVRPLEGQIALVTGASRGIGRGIALQLGKAGATVYLTGRQPSSALGSTQLGLPTLEQTAKDIAELGGEPIPVYCDHANSADVKKLFNKIEKENDGILDILANCAYSGIPSIFQNVGKKFYECDPEQSWDDINNVGLRNVYICCSLAARLMVGRRTGIIINISSGAGLQYFFSVPYGVGKAGIDRMSIDMALELKNQGVTVLPLWPGPVMTELSDIAMQKGILVAATKLPQPVLEATMRSAETPEFVGKAVVALCGDKNKIKKSGKIQITADLAREYGFSDVGGVVPANMRSIRSALEFFGWLHIAKLVPSFIRLPKPFLHFASYKF